MAQGVLPRLFGSDPPAAADPQMAITFDDLPAHGALPPGETRVAVASKIIAALRDAQVPPIYGFVNGLPIEQQPADAVVLQAWRAAGFPLGNHTWSHMNRTSIPLRNLRLTPAATSRCCVSGCRVKIGTGSDSRFFPKVIHQKRKAPLGTFSCNAATMLQ